MYLIGRKRRVEGKEYRLRRRCSGKVVFFTLEALAQHFVLSYHLRHLSVQCQISV